MISKEEIPRTLYNPKHDVYYMHYKDITSSKFNWDEFTSDVTLVTKEELENILNKYNYFKN